MLCATECVCLFRFHHRCAVVAARYRSAFVILCVRREHTQYVSLQFAVAANSVCIRTHNGWVVSMYLSCVQLSLRNAVTAISSTSTTNVPTAKRNRIIWRCFCHARFSNSYHSSNCFSPFLFLLFIALVCYQCEIFCGFGVFYCVLLGGSSGSVQFSRRYENWSTTGLRKTNKTLSSQIRSVQ